MDKETVKQTEEQDGRSPHLAFAIRSDEEAERVTEAVAQLLGIRRDVIQRLPSRILDEGRAVGSKETDAHRSVEDFVSSRENRERAEVKALELWNLLTRNADVGQAERLTFSASEVVRRTTLSHSRLREVITLFTLFGLAHWTLPNREFRFVFSRETRLGGLRAVVLESVVALNDAISIYRGALDGGTDEAERGEAERCLREELTLNIPFLSTDKTEADGEEQKGMSKECVVYRVGLLLLVVIFFLVVVMTRGRLRSVPERYDPDVVPEGAGGDTLRADVEPEVWWTRDGEGGL